MGEATLIQDSGMNTVTFTAGAAMTPGDIVALPDGRAGVVAGLANVASGDPVACHVAGVFQVAKLSSDANAVGESLYWDDTNKWLTETAGGNLYVGKCFATAAALTTTTLVALNVTTQP